MLKTALKIVKALNNKGYETVVTGGCVRDLLLLNEQPHDVDILTLARPVMIQQIAKENGWPTKAVGAAFGVIVVHVDTIDFEVATVRSEVYGADPHRPESVQFLNTIEEDLSRRDFTFNALALREPEIEKVISGDIENLKVIDLFGGVNDFKNKTVQVIGNGNSRFQEDPLRILRAFRFSARFGFKLGLETYAAICDNVYRIKELSIERIIEEMNKLLSLNKPVSNQINLMNLLGIFNLTAKVKEDGKVRSVEILPEIYPALGWESILRAIDNLQSPPTRNRSMLRWAALLSGVTDNEPSGTKTKDVLTRLKFPVHKVKQITWLTLYYNKEPKNTSLNDVNVKLWIVKLARHFKNKTDLQYGVGELFAVKAAFNLVDEMESHRKTFDLFQTVDMILQKTPFYVKELKVNGFDIEEILHIKGKDMGDELVNILAQVQFGNWKNNKDFLTVKLHEKSMGNRGIYRLTPDGSDVVEVLFEMVRQSKGKKSISFLVTKETQKQLIEISETSPYARSILYKIKLNVVD